VSEQMCKNKQEHNGHNEQEAGGSRRILELARSSIPQCSQFQALSRKKK
jgi:hypothetical protein